jgi:DNA-binding transcriptional MerR regulator
MLNEQLLIHELAEQAKTTVRTIRYYTDEGLLPEPVIQGKYAYYNINHLHRLELIRRMKDSFLPLREIRQIINSLSDSEIHQRLQERANASVRPEPEPAQHSGKKALEYIASLLNEQSAHRSQPGTPAPAPPAQVPTPPGETWMRIQLTSGVELSLRQSPDPVTAARIDQLITFAKRLFS